MFRRVQCGVHTHDTVGDLPPLQPVIAPESVPLLLFPGRRAALVRQFLLTAAAVLVVGVTRMPGAVAPENKQLHRFPPTTLGEAAASGSSLCSAADLGDQRWVVVWIDPRGRLVHSVRAMGSADWPAPAPVLGDRPDELFDSVVLTGDAESGWNLVARPKGGDQEWRGWCRAKWDDDWESVAATAPQPISQPGLPPRTLASHPAGEATVLLRSGNREVGVPPRFPSAGLVVAVAEEERWRDVGFVDETPDLSITSAAFAVGSDDRALACYIVPGAEGRGACRVIELSLAASDRAPTGWRRLAPYPDSPGRAGLIAGVHDGRLIAAGGSYFPDAPPWEGGKKVTRAALNVYDPQTNVWQPTGELPEPRAYAAVVSIPDGVLLAGGENADRIFGDCLILQLDGRDIRTLPAAPLPMAITQASMAFLDGRVYLAGGYKEGSPRVSTDAFWQLDLAELESGWKTLPTWPGPTRAQAVMAALDGALYLLSGLELRTDAGGNAQTTYLRDAFRYRPDQNAWERLPDLPWSAVAAPSPAPVTEKPARVFVLGGVDGRQAGKLPRDTRLPDDILFFDVAGNQWKLWSEPWPIPVVTVPAVRLGDEWLVVSGESMSGVRTPETWAWRISER